MDKAMREATTWVLELDSAEVPMERMVQWQRWLNQHPRHAQEFARIEELVGRMGKIRKVPWPTAEELAGDRELPLTHAPLPQGERDFRKYALAAAAGVLLTLSALFLADYPRTLELPGLISVKRIETPAGGTQKLTLSDGSTLDVSGRSILRAMLTRRARNIALERGEAFFRVAKDPARPFTVHAGDTTITAVGTAFNVRRAGDRVIVAVAEGAVRVASAESMTELRAGEQASAERTTTAFEKIPIDTGSVAAWRDGRLRYLNEPLGSVVADVGRYTARDIEINDPSLSELRITGTVLEHNLDGWLQSLEEAFPVAISRNADGSVTIDRRVAKRSSN